MLYNFVKNRILYAYFIRFLYIGGFMWRLPFKADC